MLKDLQHGIRKLLKDKLLSSVVISLIGLGIGANALIFSFVEALLLKPLAVKNPGNLYLLEQNFEQQVRPDTSFSYREFEALTSRKDLFSGAVAEQSWSESDLLPLGETTGVRLVMAQVVSANYFSELRIRATLGRVLTESDAHATSNVPAVLSYQFWESQFNRNPAVIGQIIRLKKVPFVIVGVLPRDFHSIDIERAPDVRLPISAVPALTGHPVELPFDKTPEYQLDAGFSILVRLAPGVTAQRAAIAITPDMWRFQEWYTRQRNPYREKPWPREDLERYIQEVHRSRAAFERVGRGMSQLREQFSRALELLMGAVGLLFFAVCATIAGLLLAKSEERRREIAVRLSIGATRWRMVRQLLSENLLLAVAGAALGIAFAYALSPLMVQLLPAPRGLDQFVSPRILNITPDARVLLASIGLCVLSVIFFGTAPALRGTQLDIQAELKGSGRSSSKAAPGIASVAVQVAFGVILLATATLMMRTFWNLEHLSPGFDRAHIVGFTINAESAGYSVRQANTFFHEAQDAVSAIPGVRAVGYASRGVMRGAGIKMTLAPQAVVLPHSTFLNTSLNEVSPSFFEAMGIPLLAGRNLAPSDLGKKPTPTVVNRALADLLFPHQDPIGKYLVQGVDGRKPPTSVIVGLVGTAKYRSMREPDPPTCYDLPDEEWNAPSVLYVRTFRGPARMIRSVTEAFRKIDPGMPVVETNTLEQEVQNSLWQERLVALLSGFFGFVAVALAALGIYGALAYSVVRRTRELGVRIAIGAQLSHVIQTVCGRLLWSVGIGLAAGTVASISLLGITRRLLYGIEPLDSGSFGATLGAVLLCGALAAAIPSRRAVKTDPSVALREE